MPEVTYVEACGTRHTVEVEPGLSAMEGAIRNGVPGIDGDCGGKAACATCHVFVDPMWIEKAGHAHPLVEEPLLELAEGKQENSRLACQIMINVALDGLVLHMPEAQF